jgi:hypothetical protein
VSPEEFTEYNRIRLFNKYPALRSTALTVQLNDMVHEGILYALSEYFTVEYTGTFARFNTASINALFTELAPGEEVTDLQVNLSPYDGWGPWVYPILHTWDLCNLCHREVGLYSVSSSIADRRLAYAHPPNVTRLFCRIPQAVAGERHATLVYEVTPKERISLGEEQTVEIEITPIYRSHGEY